jgi:HAD superfamily hydrolase (TIGR01509 family)
MDGTLLDSLAVQVESYRLAILDLGGPDRSHEEMLEAFAHGPAEHMLEDLIGRPVGAEAVRRYESYLRERTTQVRPYEGIVSALEKLSSHTQLGVFTAANATSAELLLVATGLRSFFRVVIGADLVGRPKPAPDGLLMACDKLHVTPAQVAYVGDGPADIAVARACGSLAVAAGWGYQYVPGRDVDVLADTPASLLQLMPPDVPSLSFDRPRRRGA